MSMRQVALIYKAPNLIKPHPHCGSDQKDELTFPLLSIATCLLALRSDGTQMYVG